MSPVEYYKLCPECNEHFDARRLNQKYCKDECKIRFNNRKLRTSYHARKEEESIFQNDNAIISKNYKILKQFIGQTVKKEALFKLGFVTRHVTRFEPIKNKTIFFCYDIGYEFLDKETLTIFKST